MISSQKSVHSGSRIVGFSGIMNYLIDLLIDKRGFYENAKTDVTFKKHLWNVISRSVDVYQAINDILIQKITALVRTYKVGHMA